MKDRTALSITNVSAAAAATIPPRLEGSGRKLQAACCKLQVPKTPKRGVCDNPFPIA